MKELLNYFVSKLDDLFSIKILNPNEIVYFSKIVRNLENSILEGLDKSNLTPKYRPKVALGLILRIPATNFLLLIWTSFEKIKANLWKLTSFPESSHNL